MHAHMCGDQMLTLDIFWYHFPTIHSWEGEGNRGERLILTDSKDQQWMRVPDSEASQYYCLRLRALVLQVHVTM